MAHEFLARDLKNLCAFFRRKGVREAEPAAIMAQLRHERTTKTEKAVRLAKGLDEEE